jgi:vacuolar-type H+-ATPase subunit H
MSESVQGEGGRLQQTGQTARAETSATVDQARQAAGQVASTAVQQAKEVADEARQQASSVVQDLRSRAMDEAEGQTRRAAGVLRQWARDLSDLAENAPGDSPARSVVAQVADRGHRAADYVDKQGVEGIVGDLQRFARRRPGMFLGGALLAGLAMGRLGKVAGQVAQSGDGGQSAGAVPSEYSAEPDTPTPPPGAGQWTPAQPVSPPAAPYAPSAVPPTSPAAGDMPASPHPGV